MPGLRKKIPSIDKIKAEIESRFPRYKADPVGYARDCLDLYPWAGEGGEPGQLELFESIAESVTDQLAGGEKAENAIRWFRIQSCHGVGKTFGCAGLVNWFFDCFQNSIVLTTAPTAMQIEKLLWKDIKKLRPKVFPGTVLPTAPEMRRSSSWFAFGTSTNDNGGGGTERFQGQHGPYLLFILDEAEGIESWVFDAVNAMMTGGEVVLCVMIGNPRTRTSRFYRIGDKKGGIKSFRFDGLSHPNVVRGEEVVPGAITRRWVREMIQDHCEPVSAHNEDDFTFEVEWMPGIWLPDDEFLFRVRGIAPPNAMEKTIIPAGRYEAACKREEPSITFSGTRATIGIDVAREGNDSGTIYLFWKGRARRVARLTKKKTGPYVGVVKEIAEELREAGVTSLHIRIDGGGGFGGGVIDRLADDLDFCSWFDDLRLFEIHFNASPHNEIAWANLITEIYGAAAETLRGIVVENPPEELEEDLTSREYEWKNRKGVEVKALEVKAKFKKRIRRSPDDGDGFVLSIAPDYLFEPIEREEVISYAEEVDLAVF